MLIHAALRLPVVRARTNLRHEQCTARIGFAVSIVGVGLNRPHPDLCIWAGEEAHFNVQVVRVDLTERFVRLVMGLLDVGPGRASNRPGIQTSSQWVSEDTPFKEVCQVLCDGLAEQTLLILTFVFNRLRDDTAETLEVTHHVGNLWIAMVN